MDNKKKLINYIQAEKKYITPIILLILLSGFFYTIPVTNFIKSKVQAMFAILIFIAYFYKNRKIILTKNYKSQ